MFNLKSVGIHGTELAGYSSIVGQPIMLKNEAGNYIGQLALIGFQGDYKEAVAAIANALDAPNRHAYKVGFAAGRADALREAAKIAWDMDAKYLRSEYIVKHNRKRYDLAGVERCENKTANVISEDIHNAILALINKEPKP